jgi:hypothetical protein
MGLCRRCWTIYSTQVWAYRARAHKPFLSFGSVTFPGRDREVEVIKKRCFSSHLRSRGKVACQAGLTIGNSSFLFFFNGSSSLSTLLRTWRFAYWMNERTWERVIKEKATKVYYSTVKVSGWVCLASPTKKK